MDEKKYFVLKLVPPRPSFAIDMTEDEKAVMMKHVAYWADLLSKRIAIVFGPVNDPKGVYGIGIMEVDNEEQLNVLTASDPALTLGNKYEIYPMFRAKIRD